MALLAWSEQIRSMTREARDLEGHFLERYKLTREQLRRVLNPVSPADKLRGLGEIMKSGKLASALDVKALAHFETFLAKSDSLRTLHRSKYWLAVILTVSLFLAGIASILIRPTTPQAVILLLALPLLLLSWLLGLIIKIGRVEGDFFASLKALLDRL